MILEQYQKDLERFNYHPYRSKWLKPYYARYSKDRTKIIVDDNVKDMLNAQGFHTDEAPRSIYRVEKLFKALSLYAPGKIQRPRPGKDYQAGISLARKCFARPKDAELLSVLPFTPSTIALITSNPSGSAGLTNYGCTKAESQTRALERGLQTIKKEKAPEPCIAYARTHFDDGTRLIWGYPYSMTVIEGLLAKPLLDVFKKGYTPMAFAMTTGALGTKLRVASYHKEWAYSLDMSKFDAHISAELIHVAFEILRTWFDPDQIEEVSGVTVREIFNLIEHYFIHTTIVMPDGNIYKGKDHGVPSGSYFTQIIDSIVNVIVAGAISHRYSLNVSRKEIFVLGDDLLMWSNRKVDLNKIAKYVWDTFSLKVHGSEKSRIFHYDEAIHYLGRDWEQGLPTLDQQEVLKRMIYPEKFRVYSKDPAEREREVKMMLLAYAATYRSAWRIAYLLLDPSDSWTHNGCANTDVNTYCYGNTRGKTVDPEHLTGLMRYKLRYQGLPSHGSDIPITATQYWL